MKPMMTTSREFNLQHAKSACFFHKSPHVNVAYEALKEAYALIDALAEDKGITVPDEPTALAMYDLFEQTESVVHGGNVQMGRREAKSLAAWIGANLKLRHAPEKLTAGE